jgi:uncharacterized glyoxalase superfamily protein PhnB
MPAHALSPIPVFRSFDESKAKEFYVDFLGFSVDWQHRFEPQLPLYMQLSLGACLLHLSEHFGDASPGSHIRIPITDVASYCAELNAKRYQNARPGFQAMPWGTTDMTINDPFGNRVTFTCATAR